MHAVEMAAHLGVATVLVPRNAGVLSAFGLLMSDPVKDYTRSLMRTDAQVTLARLEAEFRILEEMSRRDMLEDGFSLRDVALERSLDCRYLGQSYEIDVPYRKARTLNQAFLESFHRRHKRLYSYRHDKRPVEIVNVRIKAVAVTPKLPLVREPRAAGLDPQALLRRRKIHTGRAVREGAVYDRARLRPGNVVRGPALVIDPESTAFLPPAYVCRVDAGLTLVIRTGGRP
jgi:N-methylhydantoinase A/oxoprolinase/acetone carboxylase beta subunit